MTWEIKPFHAAETAAITTYLLDNEEYWTGLTGRLFRNRRLIIPAHTNDIHTIHEGNSLYGVVYNNSDGYTFPAVQWPWANGTEEALKELFTGMKKITTLLGDSHVVDLCILHRHKQPAYRVDYLLMARPVSNTLIPEQTPGGEEILLADRSMARALYPLQRDYEKEEVLLQPEKFNSLICMTHLKETLGNQIVYTARRNRQFIAKAGTNARGVNWSQIGGVYTVPELRSQGISRRLMQRILISLSGVGQGASLFVKRNNLPAVHLYRKLRFNELAHFSIAYFLK